MIMGTYSGWLRMIAIDARAANDYFLRGSLWQTRNPTSCRKNENLLQR